MKNLLEISDLSKNEILSLIELAIEIKKNPKKYSEKLKNKTLFMFFEKPSLRTRVSFEVAMNQLGGSALYYDLSNSPLAHGKETIEDTSKVISRYCDAIVARVFEQETLEKLAKNSEIPIINALSNDEHPCQILGDLLTIKEKFNTLNIKLAYLGDCNNNVTHSLIKASNILGFNMNIACPNKKEYLPKIKLGKIKLFHNALDAVKGSKIVYTDSWMSYHIPKNRGKKRVKDLKNFQVNNKVMKNAEKNAVFMHCLPALRGQEVTSNVMDGKKSIVFDQAYNRLPVQKAILLKLLNK